MKAYTDLKQSKKLAKILPLESADMRYGYIAPYDFSDRMYDGGYDEVPYPKDFLLRNPNFSANDYDGELPAWSLAALLSVLPSVIIRNDKRMFLTLDKVDAYDLYYKSDDRLDELWETDFEPIDACYKMILDLHELKML